MDPKERINFKCYSVLKRRFGLTILQIREKKDLIDDIPFLIEANCNDDFNDFGIIN